MEIKLSPHLSSPLRNKFNEIISITFETCPDQTFVFSYIVFLQHEALRLGRSSDELFISTIDIMVKIISQTDDVSLLIIENAVKKHQNIQSKLQNRFHKIILFLDLVMLVAVILLAFCCNPFSLALAIGIGIGASLLWLLFVFRLHNYPPESESKVQAEKIFQIRNSEFQPEPDQTPLAKFSLFLQNKIHAALERRQDNYRPVQQPS
jgi:hypothetical protein